MKTRLRDGFIAEIKTLAKKYASLNLALSQHPAPNIQLKEKKQILEFVIKPLFAGSQWAYLYGDGENIGLQDRLSTILFKKGKKYQFNLQKNIFDGFEEFWGMHNGGRGSIIWENDFKKITLVSVLKLTYDPFVLSNLGATLNKSAITTAQKVVISDQDKIAFGLSPNNGFEWLTIFVNKSQIASLVDLAFDNCKLSDSFLKLYSHRNPS
ncbi:MAG: hypothetical protein AB1724_20300 [Thermodesulfobacteriota bacterium]